MILTLTDHGNEMLSMHLKLSASKTLMSASLLAVITLIDPLQMKQSARQNDEEVSQIHYVDMKFTISEM